MQVIFMKDIICITHKICKNKEKTMLNINEIMEIIPQRAPFLMIDRVEEYVPGESCTAYKNL